MNRLAFVITASVCASCGSDGGEPSVGKDASPIPVPAASCAATPGGGSLTVSEPELTATLFDRWHEAWLGSPALVDLDGDGEIEILVPRGGLLLGWHLDGEEAFRADTGEGRIWSSPVVADLLTGEAGLEVAVAARGNVYLFLSDGTSAPGFPVSWRDELRTLAAGDIDGDGQYELVAVTSNRLEAGGMRDTVIAFEATGEVVPGFPPNTTGASGCDDACYVTGGFDQNVALGDVDGDGDAEIFVTQDNAYLSLYDGDGRAFDAASIFEDRTKFSGVRFLHDYALAQQGYADDEESANQAHFTNSAPAIADIDGDGDSELIVVGSVQNAAQSDRERGVALWVLNADGTRPNDWTEPFHAPEFVSGLWDFEGSNIVGATNQVTVADLDPASPGMEMVFAGFDGRIHAVTASRQELWNTIYTTSDRVLTGGVLVVDLSSDGRPEVVVATYSTEENVGNLLVFDAGGNRLHETPLPGRGAMPVPSIGDIDGDGVLEIVVSLKDGEDRVQQVLVFRVPGSSENCLLWPTGRGNLARSGFVASPT